MSIVRLFNEHFIEFIDDLIRVIPQNPDIRAFRLFLRGVAMTSPQTPLTVWRTSLSIPYAKQIRAKDFNFFVQKDYTKDIAASDIDTQGYLCTVISKLRGQVASMTVSDQKKSLKYVENLSKLADLYFEDSN